MTTISAATATAASALAAAATRLNVSAENVANADTVGAPPGAGAPRSQTSYVPLAADQSTLAGGGVKVTVRQVSPGYFMAYGPGSPGADRTGMVATPDVDPIAETVNQIQAVQSYKANLDVLKTADEMEKAALDISA